MADYSNVIQVGIGMVIIIAIGYILAKLGIVTIKNSSSLNQLSFKVGFLPLVMRAIAPRDLSSLNFQPFFIAGLMSLSIFFLIGIILFMPFNDRTGTYLATVLPCCYINYIISGLPVFNSLWPPEENVMVSMMTLSNDLVTAPIYLILVGIYNIQKTNKERLRNGLEPESFSFKMFGTILFGVIKSPILIGNLLGILYAATGFGIPLFLHWIMQLCGDMVFSLSLICVGVFLAQHSLMACHWVQFVVGIIMRFFAGGALAGFFCWAIGVSPRVSRQCIIIGSQPTAVASYVLTTQAHLGEGFASTMILWTTLLTVPVIIIWFTILDKLNLFVE